MKATFEDHPTDPDKVILRKKPRIDQGPDYERGFIDGMQYQMQSSVDKAVNRMAQPEQEPVIGTKTWIEDGKVVTQHLTAKDIYKDPEQPEQEPVAWYHQEEYKTHFTSIPSQDMIENGYWQPLYATPPQRTWVGLTPEDYNEIFKQARTGEHAVQLAEAKLKGNNT